MAEMAPEKECRAVTYSVIIFTFLSALCCSARYTPTWESLDTRVTPPWFAAAKFGISVHWGVYSVPSCPVNDAELLWDRLRQKHTDVSNCMNRLYKPGFTYQELAPLFTAELFNPEDWASIFSRAGARYVILTAKGDDGFTLWPSNYSLNWNAMDVGPHRDLLGDLCDAVRRRGGMRFGVDYSRSDKFHPLYIADRASGWATADFPRARSTPELTELVERYHPDIILSQNEAGAPSTYWNSTSFLAWLYNDSPVRSEVVVNDGWGDDVRGKHGDFIGCHVSCDEKALMESKWLKYISMDKYSWGYRQAAKSDNYRKVRDIIYQLVTTISRNGNLLLGVSATKEGIIPPIVQERLDQVGTWLRVNGEAVYNATLWKHQEDAANPNVRYTAKGNTVYVFMLQWPKDKLLYLQSLKVSSQGQITMLGRPTERLAQLSTDLLAGTIISLPALTPDELPTPWAWVLKVEGAL